MAAALTGATEVVSRFVAHGARSGPRHAQAVARLLVDTVGVAVAAADTTPVVGLRRWLEAEGLLAHHSAGAAIWGGDAVVSPTAAALLNATAGHALDWDDASPTIPSHPATVLLPAILAVSPAAANRDDSGRVDGDLLVRAYSVGSAVLRAVAEALPDTDHYARGWHTTATVGRLAAVASVAVVTGLDERRTRTALGIATSMVAGSRANFGTDTKSLHAGLAARDAVAAVGMAKAGLTAHPGVLEHPEGLFALYGGNSPDPTELAARLDHWADGWLEDYAIKVYPSCYATHRPLDGLLRLRAAGLRAEDVESVHVTVETGWLRALRPTEPTTGLEAKFSLPYTAAVALLDGAVGQHHFTDEALALSAPRRLMARVTSSEADHPPIGGPADGSWAVVRVTTISGDVHETRVDATHGDARDPLEPEVLSAKFTDAVGLPAARARVWAESLSGLVDASDLGELNARLGGPPVAQGPTPSIHPA